MPITIVTPSFVPSIAQSIVQTFSESVLEGNTSTLAFTLVGPGNSAISNTQLISADLTLIDERTKQVINDRIAQDVLGAGTGANDVVIDVVSLITFAMSGLDNPHIDVTETVKYEWHRAIFNFSYDIGSGVELATVEFRIPVKIASKLQLPATML